MILSLCLSLSLLLRAADPVTLSLLPPGEGNPRNSEGDFVRLKDGRWMLIYSKFTSHGPADSGAAHLAARYSTDDGRTWSSDDRTIVENEAGMNVMSVSLLRLKSGEIALFYARKNSMLDCRPYLRVSKDEGKTWSAAHLTIPDVGYFVLNNNRVVQLKSGRLLLPVALHKNETADPASFNGRGVAMTYFSDDKGKTWRRSRTVLENPDRENRTGLQEPGIVVLKDGRLLMFIRTGMGSQYYSYSKDNGDTWSPVEASSLQSPVSPASIARIPKTGDLLVVWNDHAEVSDAIRNKRTPMTVAISRDEGKTWEKRKNLHEDPAGWYCYTAVAFAGDRVLLTYTATAAGEPKLSRSVITHFDIDWLYQ
jgi:sialidase-1